VTVSFDATDGNHRLEAVIDPDNEVAESDESNNELVSHFSVVEREPSTAPVASANYWNDANEIELGASIEFRGTGTDEDGNIELYEWDFNGDGIYEWSSSENGRTNFTFNSEGTFTAVLRVTDNDGFTATDSRVITVGDGGGSDDDSGFLPAPSLAAAVAAVAVIALRRRRGD